MDKAKVYLSRAIELIDKSESKEITGYAFLNLGHTYVKEKNFSAAIESFKQAESIWEEIAFAKGLYYLENNYAGLEIERGNLIAYEKHLTKAIEIMEQDSILNSSLAYVQLGYFYADQGREDEALENLQKAIKVSDGTNDNEFLDLATTLIRIYGKRQDENKIKEVSKRIEDIYKYKLGYVQDQASKWKSKEFILESKIIENKNLLRQQKEAAYKAKVKNLLLALLSGLILLMSVLLYFWLKSRKLKEALSLEKVRAKISKDLHDDVGSDLAEISFQTEILSTQLKGAHRNLSVEVSAKAKDAIGKMRDMIWAIDARRNTPIDLEFKMKDYASAVLDGSSIEYSFDNDVPKNIKGLISEVKHTFYLVFKESIYNITKHSTADKVAIKLFQKGNQLIHNMKHYMEL
ncbi:MAG: histidine kinase, partial [Bacteroidota bacterium]